MPQGRMAYRWGVIGHSQLGASHVRHGLPNQDAIRSYALPDGSPPVVLAVADGHGSAKSFRSHVGAMMAVETAVQICREFVEGIGDAVPSAVKTAAEQHIPARLFQAWKRRVTDHWVRNPFTEDELARLADEAGPKARERAASGEQPQVAYGATLLAALLTNDFLICIQLGDGEILAVSDTTREVARVVPKDEALIANETTSLCQDDAIKHVQCRFQLIQDRPPGLVLLSTDGYSNSFASSDAFLKVGTDYLEMIRADGAETVGCNLPKWLEEASREGSGDDITLGIIYRQEPPLSRPPVEMTGESQVVTSVAQGASPAEPPGSDKAQTGSSEASATEIAGAQSPLPGPSGFTALASGDPTNPAKFAAVDVPISTSGESTTASPPSRPMTQVEQVGSDKLKTGHATVAPSTATEQVPRQDDLAASGSNFIKRVTDGIGWVFGRKESS
jgi:serine/threonine protein phosphatase PrpC